MTLHLSNEGAQAEHARAESMPWLNRRERGRFKAWLSTIGMALAAPRRLMQGVTSGSGWGQALWFAVITLGAICLVSLLPFALSTLPAVLVLSRLRGPSIAVAMIGSLAAAVLVGFVGTIVLMCLWGPVTHGVLCLTGRTTSGIRHTCHATFYSSGANVFTAVPIVGIFVGWIWWFVSAILMVKETQKVHALRASVALLVLPGLTVAALVWLTPVLLPSGSGAGAAGCAGAAFAIEVGKAPPPLPPWPVSIARRIRRDCR